MLEILTETTNVGMQSVYTPLSMKAHLYFCIIATALYLMQYYRRGSWHYLLMMVAVDLTFATQTNLCRTSGSVAVLGIVEAVVLGAALFFYLKYNKQQKAIRAAQMAAEDEKAEKIEAAEKQESDPVENAFDDND